MGIRDRWISLLHRAATGIKKTLTLLTPIGMFIFGIFTGLFVILAVLVGSACGSMTFSSVTIIKLSQLSSIQLDF